MAVPSGRAGPLRDALLLRQEAQGRPGQQALLRHPRHVRPKSSRIMQDLGSRTELKFQMF